MDIEFQCCKMKKVWRLVILTLLNCTLKMIKTVNFMFCLFYPQLYRQIDTDLDLKGEGNYSLLSPIKVYILYI